MACASAKHLPPARALQLVKSKRGNPMLMPPIGRYMTRQPWTLASNATLVEAYELMRAREIRHVPIVDNSHLKGVLSERDLFRLEPFVQLRDARVRDAMIDHVYTARIDDPLDVVVRMMSERKYGCAVIVGKDGAVEGIFTTTDVCRALAELLERAAA